MRTIPRRYARRGELTALSELKVDEHVTIVAEVLEVRDRPMRQRRGSIVEARISDGKGVLVLTFFNQKWRMNDLRIGARGIFAGKITDYRGSLQLAHPDYELFEDDDGRRSGARQGLGRAADPDLSGDGDRAELEDRAGDRRRAGHPAGRRRPGAG